MPISHSHEEEIASSSNRVYYLSMEYLPEGRWEELPVVFSIKTVIGQEPDWDDWDDNNPPIYAVYHFSVEPVRGDRTRTPSLWRISPDVVGLKPTEKGGLPRFGLSGQDSVAEFYFPVPVPGTCSVHGLCQDLLELCWQSAGEGTTHRLERPSEQLQAMSSLNSGTAQLSDHV